MNTVPGGSAGSAEVLFEMTPYGGQMRIVAIHAASGVEVITAAPLGLSQAQMQMLGLKKLRWVLERQQKGKRPA